MAKRDLNIFARTEPGTDRERTGNDNSDLDQGNIQATGVGLRAGEVAALDQLAGELGVSRNALMRFALRWFLLELRAGRVDPEQYLEEPPPPKKSLRLPGQE